VVSCKAITSLVWKHFCAFTLCKTKLLIALRWTHAHKHTLLRVCLTSINVKTFRKVYGIFSLQENFHTGLQTCVQIFFVMKLIEEPSVFGNSIGAYCCVKIFPKFVSYSHHLPLGSQNKVLVVQNIQKIASNTSVRISCLSHYFMAFAWTYQHQLFDFAWFTVAPPNRHFGILWYWKLGKIFPQNSKISRIYTRNRNKSKTFPIFLAQKKALTATKRTVESSIVFLVNNLI